MSKTLNLRIPGPTPLPPEVRVALARQMTNHRGPDFIPIMRDVHTHLQHFFVTEHPVLTFPAVGTGGLEASIANVFSPGDEVLAVTIGSFGERYAEIATAFGLTVHRVDYEWGDAAQASDIAEAMIQHPNLRGILITQNETSTGVLNPIAEIAQAIRSVSDDVLILVDGISGLGAAPLLTDLWDLDIVITGSQKSWMAPPGMAMLSVSPRAWTAVERSQLPKFYFDFKKARQNFDDQNPPYTPAIGIYYALHTALSMMREEGREAIWDRHASIGAHTREAVQELGLQLFCTDPGRYSASVTAFKVPDGVDGKELIKKAREQFNVEFAGGQGKLAGKIVRIGHLGWVTNEDIDEAIEALKAVL